MYYLPIYVNNRRMHVVKLSQTIEEVLPSFLVNSSNHYDVFSLPSERIQLICDEGNKENVDLVDAHYELDCVDCNDAPEYRHSENIPVYNIRICSGKGINFDNYSDEDILLMINHINNVKRKSLDNQTPYELLSKKIGEENIKKLGIYYIDAKDIILKPSLFKDNNK